MSLRTTASSAVLSSAIALTLSVTSLSAQVESRGNGNANIGKNNGVVIIESNDRTSREVLREVRKESELKLEEDRGYLATLIAPSDVKHTLDMCEELLHFEKASAVEPLVVHFGPDTEVCLDTFCPVIVGGTREEPSILLSVTRGKHEVQVSAEVYDKDAEIVAEIKDNVPHINRNKLFDWIRPNKSTLDLIDNKNKRIMHLALTDNRTLDVEGVFYFISEGQLGKSVEVQGRRVVYSNGGASGGNCYTLNRSSALVVYRDRLINLGMTF
jgi:hypothetical protein